MHRVTVVAADPSSLQTSDSIPKHRSFPKLLGGVLLVLLVLLVLGVGGLLVREKLTKSAEKLLTEQLIESAVPVTYDSRQADPVRGLVVKNLVVYHDLEKTRPVLRFDEVAFSPADVEMSARGIAAAVRIRSGFSLVGEDGTELRVEEVGALVHVERDAVRIDRFTGRVGDLQLDLAGTYRLDPSRVDEPVQADLSRLTEEALSRMAIVAEGDEPPRATLRFDRDERAPEDMKIDLKLQGETFRVGRLIIESMDVVLLQEGPEVSLDPCIWHLAGGRFQIAGKYYPGQALWRIPNAYWDLNPLLLATMLAPEDTPELRDWEVAKSPVFKASDIVINELDPSANRLKAEVGGDCEMVWKGQGAHLEVRELEGVFEVQDGVFRSPGLSVRLGDGRLRLEGSSPFDPALSLPYDFTVKAEDLPLGQLARSADNEALVEGLFSLDLRGHGEGIGREGLQATGKAFIDEGTFLSLPMLSGLAKVLKGSKSGNQTLSVDFRLDGGDVTVEDLHLTTKGAQLLATGSYEAAENRVQIVGRVKLRGLAGMATGFLSKMLEVEGSGPPGKMEWRLRNLGGSGPE